MGSDRWSVCARAQKEEEWLLEAQQGGRGKWAESFCKGIKAEQQIGWTGKSGVIGAVGDDGPGEAAKGQVKVRLRILAFTLKAMERH